MEKNYKRYAIRRGDKWLDRRNNWDTESYRKLYNTKQGCIRALNEADKIGIKPSDPFQVALTCTDTYIVAVLVKVSEIDKEWVPVKVKMKKFRHRSKWFRKQTPDAEGVMASYDVDAMPGFMGCC